MVIDNISKTITIHCMPIIQTSSKIICNICEGSGPGKLVIHSTNTIACKMHSYIRRSTD